MFKWNFLYSGCAHCLLYFHQAPLKSVWLCLLYSPIKYLYALIRSPLLYNPSSLTLCSYMPHAPRCGPSSVPTPLLYTGKPSTPDVCTDQHSLGCCWPPLLRGHYWLMVSSSASTLRSFRKAAFQTSLCLWRCIGFISASLLP